MEEVDNMITKLMMKLRSFKESESGATAIEYGLIAAGIGVAIVSVVGGVGSELNNLFEQIQTDLQ